jgi:hypothetical protein
MWFLELLGRRPSEKAGVPLPDLGNALGGLALAGMPTSDALPVSGAPEEAEESADDVTVTPGPESEDLDQSLLSVFDEAGPVVSPSHRLADSVEPVEATRLAGDLRMLLQHLQAPTPR